MRPPIHKERLELMDEKEANEFAIRVRQNNRLESISYLDRSIRLNLVLKQQLEIRNQVLQEMINERSRSLPYQDY